MDSKDKVIARLRQRIAEQNRQLDAQSKQLGAKDKRIAKLEQRLSEIERRLGLDSSTSSKPPSSDGLRKKPAPRSPTFRTCIRG